jgi:acetoin utilization protein AcuB
MTAKDTVDAWMTRSLHVLSGADTVERATALFSEFGFRHLPVVDRGKLVGILSERDLFVASKFTPTHGMKVEIVMSPEPYVVAPSTSLSEVARAMVEQRQGAAVVVDQGRPVGVFTAVDALRALAG